MKMIDYVLIAAEQNQDSAQAFADNRCPLEKYCKKHSQKGKGECKDYHGRQFVGLNQFGSGYVICGAINRWISEHKREEARIHEIRSKEYHGCV